MKYDESSAKTLIKQATTVVIDDEVYEVNYCDDDWFECTDEDGNPNQFYYSEIDLEKDCIYKLTLLNP